VIEVESAWGKYPDYRIEAVPVAGTARVWFGDMLLAESTSALRLEETKHVDRLYIPEADVKWELFEANDDHTVCPFKGVADYWSLTAVDPPEKNIVWTYRTPFEEVAASFLIRNEEERVALRQEHAATRALYVRWQRDLLAGVPTARIVELQGASLYMFLSNEADVLREIRAFAATLTGL